MSVSVREATEDEIADSSLGSDCSGDSDCGDSEEDDRRIVSAGDWLEVDVDGRDGDVESSLCGAGRLPANIIDGVLGGRLDKVD